MTCREILSLLPLFFDGELDARQMRSVALHSARCKSCEDELRQTERLQDLISETIHARVEEVDASGIWTEIERRLDAAPLPWWKRLQAWWMDVPMPRAIPAPALAAAVLVAVLGLLFFARAPQMGAPPNEPVVASADSGALIHSLETDLDAAIINDPQAGMILLFEDGEAPAVGEVP
jgi:anti-sigma factor RsiW